MEGLSHATIFLAGRTMDLGELLMGQFEWCLGSHSWGFGIGQLVTNSKFLTTSPYSSQVRSTGPEDSLPFFEEKPWTVHAQDLSVG
jgi:hypothetical protein